MLEPSKESLISQILLIALAAATIYFVGPWIGKKVSKIIDQYDQSYPTSQVGY